MRRLALLAGLVILSACGAAQPSRSPQPDLLSFEPVALEDGPMLLTDLKAIPGRNEILAASQQGEIFHYRIEGSGAALLGKSAVPDVLMLRDCGLSTLALDPDFTENRYVYAGHCVNRQSSRITRLTWNDADYDSIPSSAREIIAVGDPAASEPFHNVGAVVFDRDGAMMAFFGEKNLREKAQDPRSHLGKLLRIVPNRDPAGSGYTLPAGAKDAVYASGFREPWRAAYDSRGRLWVADVSESRGEEISVIERPGQNFGWPLFEGMLRAKDCPRGDCSAFTLPMLFWNSNPQHPYALEDARTAETFVRVVWLGEEYDGTRNDRYGDALDGTMLFGDFCAGWVRAGATDNGRIASTDRHAAHLEFVTGAVQADDGYIYLSTFPSSISRDGICPRGKRLKDVMDEPLRRQPNYVTEGMSALWRAVPAEQ